MTLWSFTLLWFFFPNEMDGFVTRLNERLITNRLNKRAAIHRASLVFFSLLFTFPCFVITAAIDSIRIREGQLPLIIPLIITGGVLVLQIEMIQAVRAIATSQTHIVKTGEGIWELQKKSS